MAAELLKQLQAAVRESRTEQQKKTSFVERAMFLGTEVGEVQKEVLKLQGLYGPTEAEHAKSRVRKEICDVIWNALELANQLEDGESLDDAFVALLKYNYGRVYW